VLRTLAARGIRMPEDIALVGFDDIFPASLADPPLTTVRQPIRAIGERACDRLTERIANPTLRHEVDLLPTELVIRSSCGCPPGTVTRRPASPAAISLGLSPGPNPGPGRGPGRSRTALISSEPYKER